MVRLLCLPLKTDWTAFGATVHQHCRIGSAVTDSKGTRASHIWYKSWELHFSFFICHFQANRLWTNGLTSHVFHGDACWRSNSSSSSPQLVTVCFLIIGITWWNGAALYLSLKNVPIRAMCCSLAGQSRLCNIIIIPAKQDKSRTFW